MKRKISIIITSIIVFFMESEAFIEGEAYEDLFLSPTPLESIVLELPNNGYMGWKEISRFVNEKEGLVERIPITQTIEDWSDLIAIQYIGMPAMKLKGDPSIDVLLDLLRGASLSSYPKNQISWKIIEKNKTDAIYEWTYSKSSNKPIGHEISRIFLTDSGFHRIGFTKRNKKMSLEERNDWLKKLRESTSIIPLEIARNQIQDLSVANTFMHSLNLDINFHEWEIVTLYSLENGITQLTYCPPSALNEYYLTECLEVITIPTANLGSTIDEVYEIEKANIKKRSPKKVDIEILKKKPQEIIFTYSHPKDHLQMTVVGRAFVSERGYYLISYKKGQILDEEEVGKWKDILEAIKPYQAVERV